MGSFLSGAPTLPEGSSWTTISYKSGNSANSYYSAWTKITGIARGENNIIYLKMSFVLKNDYQGMAPSVSRLCRVEDDDGESQCSFGSGSGSTTWGVTSESSNKYYQGNADEGHTVRVRSMISNGNWSTYSNPIPVPAKLYIPIYLNLDGSIVKTKAVYINRDGTIRKCDIYFNTGESSDPIKKIQ